MIKVEFVAENYNKSNNTPRIVRSKLSFPFGRAGTMAESVRAICSGCNHATDDDAVSFEIDARSKNIPQNRYILLQCVGCCVSLGEIKGSDCKQHYAFY